MVGQIPGMWENWKFVKAGFNGSKGVSGGNVALGNPHSKPEK